jgi:hypothetical protein
MTRTGREGTLQKLIETAKEMGFDPKRQQATKERLAWVLGRQKIVIEAAGVRLSAWLSDKLWLTVNVSVTRGWDRKIEAELYETVKKSRRITALLVIAEWAEIRALCERQGAVCPRELN